MGWQTLKFGLQTVHVTSFLTLRLFLPLVPSASLSPPMPQKPPSFPFHARGVRFDRTSFSCPWDRGERKLREGAAIWILGERLETVCSPPHVCRRWIGTDWAAFFFFWDDNDRAEKVAGPSFGGKSHRWSCFVVFFIHSIAECWALHSGFFFCSCVGYMTTGITLYQKPPGVSHALPKPDHRNVAFF